MVKPKISVEFKNTAVMDRLLKELPKMKKAYVSVGVHSDAEPYADGAEVAQVALWNEFGTKKTPQRSFIRAAINEHIDQINIWREEALVNIIENGWSVKKSMDGLGYKIVVLIQNKIKSNVPPPNKPSTRKHKQSEASTNWNRTLMDTEHMLQSMSFHTVMP